MPPLSEILPPWLPVAMVERLVLVLAGVGIIWFAARVARRYLGRWIKDAATRYRARKAVSVFAVAAAGIFAAFVLVDRLTGLGVAVGLIGAGIAFALQHPLLSVAGWLALAFGGYYRTSHRVEVGGVTGDVIDISILRTTLFEVGGGGTGTYSGRVVRVANAEVLRQPVYNFSGDFPFLWDEIRVPIRHDSDRRRARQLIEEAVSETVGDYAPEAQGTWRSLTRKYLLAEANVEPTVRLEADARWLTFTVRYVMDYRRRLAAKDELWTRILEAVDGADDVAIATAAQEITVAAGSELTVHSADGGDARPPTRGDPGGGPGPAG